MCVFKIISVAIMAAKREYYVFFNPIRHARALKGIFSSLAFHKAMARFIVILYYKWILSAYLKHGCGITCEAQRYSPIW